MVESHEHGSHHVSRRVLRGFTPSRFAALRKSTMTMSDLARLSGVPASTIYSWENGTFTPQVDKLAAVMKALGEPIERVVDVPVERFPGDWRVLRGLTQPQLAALAGITTARLQRIECAETAPTSEQIATLSSLLGSTAEEYSTAWQRARNRPAGTPA